MNTANKLIVNSLALALSLCVGSLAFGDPVVFPIDLTTPGFSLAADTNTAPEIADIPMTFADPIAGTVTFTLKIAMDWDVISGSDAGLTGVVFSSASGLGANSQLGLSAPDTGNIEKIGIATGGDALERLSFSVINLTSSAGAITFNGFDEPPTTADAEYRALPSGVLRATAVDGGAGFRITGLNANFVTAVPEPSQWAMLGLVGLFVGGRKLRNRFSAV